MEPVELVKMNIYQINSYRKDRLTTFWQWVKGWIFSDGLKKLIMNLYSSKESGSDCIPVMVLKNCEPVLLYIPAELFISICIWKSLVFQIVWRSHWWSLYLIRMLGKGLQLKTTILLVFLLWLVKSLKNL